MTQHNQLMKQKLILLVAALSWAASFTPNLQAATSTWNNGAADFTWSLTSANWTPGGFWVQDNDAVFGATGVGTITLGDDISVSNLTFTVSGYTIQANGKYSTNRVVTANAGTSNALALSMWGPDSLTFQGPGTTILLGDSAVNDANHYTGGTYIRGGTVILQAAGTTSSGAAGSSHAIDSVEALDAGATLVIPGAWNGVNGATSVRDQIAYSPNSRLNMTGGTLDLYNDQKNQRIPAPEGNGLIINSGPNIQSGVQALIGSTDKTFSGVIADGNNGVLATNNNFNNGPGYQIGILQLNNGANGSGGVLTLTGSNTYSGSTRIDCGIGGIRLAGNGQLGFPSPNGLTGPLRIYTGFLDLGGRNQTIALMQDGNSGGQIYNSAVGTVSTLTFGYGNELANRSCSYQFKDNTGTGGRLALRKINSAPYVHWTGPTMNSCTQTLSATCSATYSGDTSVEGGALILSGPGAVSPSSAYRIYPSNGGTLKLNYAGTANARQLWINGVQQPNGVYGASTPGIDSSSTGTITITGYAPVTLNATTSGGNLNLSWDGVYKLQIKTSIMGAWSDYAGGGESPVSVPLDKTAGSVFFRLINY